MTRYKWKAAGGIRSIKAQLAGEELERIRTSHRGKLLNRDVVDAARTKKSPLHRYFDWDDSNAAEKWRLEQAGILIRSIEVIVDVSKGKPKNLRAFVSVTRHDERSYTSLAHAMGDADLRQQVLARAWTELQGWREQYADLSEFAKIHAAIDKVKVKRAA